MSRERFQSDGILVLKEYNMSMWELKWVSHNALEVLERSENLTQMTYVYEIDLIFPGAPG